MKLFVVSLSLLLTLLCNYVLPVGPGGSFPFRHYGSAEGLPSTCVYSTFQDKMGYIWLCTDHGLSRFDGNTFKNFSDVDGLRSNYVLCMAYLGEDSLLAQTYDGGLHQVIGDSIHPRVIQGLVEDQYLQNICSDNANGVWLTRTPGIFHIKNGVARSKNIPGQIDEQSLRSQLPDSQGLWISADWGLYYVGLQDFAITAHPAFEGVHLEGLAQYKDTLYIGGLGKLYALCGDSIREYHHPEWEEGAISMIQPNFRGGILLYIKDIGAFHLINGKCYNIGKEWDLGPTKVNHFAKDASGNVWVSTYGKGLFFLPNVEAQHFSPKNGMSSQFVTALYCEGDCTWVGYPGGTDRIDPQGCRQLFSSGSIDTWTYWINRGPKGQMLYNTGWLLHQNGLGNMDSAAIVQTGNHTSRGFVFIENAQLWHTELDDFHAKKRHIGKLRAHKFYSIFESRDAGIWVCSNKGAQRFWEGKSKEYNQTNGLLSDRVYAMAEDKEGRLYFATSKGLSILFGDTWKSLTVHDGLAGNNCTQVLCDPQGRIWAGCYGGVSLIQDSSIRNIHHANGLISGEISQMRMDGKGRLWVGTPEGVSVIDAEAVLGKAKKPRLFWTANSDGKQALAPDKHHFLPFKKNFLQLSFQGIDPVFYNKVLYSYRFSGSPSGFTPTQEPRLTLSGLGPGDYSVEIMATTSLGLESDPLSFHFTVAGPWWRRPLVLFAFISILIIGVALFARWRIHHYRKLTEKQMMLDLKMASLRQQALNAAMEPHFVSNALINAHELLKKGEFEKADTYFQEFSRFMRLTLQNGLQESISLHEELERLHIYLAMQQLRYPDYLSYSIEIDPGLDAHEIEVPSMILQIFVENAIRHGIIPLGNKGHIRIQITSLESRVIMTVEDNGRGIGQGSSPLTTNRSHRGASIPITRERLAILSQLSGLPHELQLLDLKEEGARGTRVTISLPLEEGL